jgi:HNH endonuclease
VKKTRPSIPKRTEHEVLFRNQSVCCVCQKTGVQIHHLDGNPANNAIENLCVLCIEHHAQASSQSNIVKALSKSLLRKYKADWEGIVARKRRSNAVSRLHHSSKVESDLIRFEIKRIVFGLHESKSIAELNSSIDYLYKWHLVEGRQKDIIDTMTSVHWLLSLREIKIIARRLHEFFWQFISPQKIPMTKREERVIIETIVLLRFMGVQAVIFDQDRSTVQEVVKSIIWFHNTGKAYDRASIADAGISAMQGIKRECRSWKKDAPHKIEIIEKFLDRHLAKLNYSAG